VPCRCAAVAHEMRSYKGARGTAGAHLMRDRGIHVTGSPGPGDPPTLNRGRRRAA